ncbi:HotDog domain [Syntrophomonas zehnderi OL-4]|uniref:HotDog domain n=1 Tax=Syntrophomonas zehnderi OL-4 TaxID=690567 RepID=A0A0E4GF58_9FIRM|nr:MaoC family dehydratase [Syntrophomonas zehnderi]CFY02586.1 HotDog domain [Syntrophomonas zehnderi OL-4]
MNYQDKIKTWEMLKLGDAETMTKTMTESDIMLWVGITGDMNPVHIDRVYSENTRFKDVVVPGLCVAGLISAAVTKVTFGNVYAMQNLKFVKPVYIGDTITATAVIKEKLEDKRMVQIETTCVNQNNEVVIVGEAREYILA